MNPWWCGHSVTTEPDEDGYGLCLKCGSLVVLRLTRKIFEKQIAAMKRAL